MINDISRYDGSSMWTSCAMRLSADYLMHMQGNT